MEPFLLKAIKSIFACIVILASYNNVSGQLPDRCSCQVVTYSDAEEARYSNYYQELFIRRHNIKHTKWIGFPRSYFLFIDDFFKKNPNYIGVIIYLNSFNKIIDPNQQVHSKQIMLHMVPANKDTLPDFDAFPRFNSTVSFLNDPALTRVELFPNGNTNGTSKIGPEHVLLVPEYASAYLRKNYRNRYTFLNKRHSRGMFLCKDTFLALGSYLLSDNTIDAVKINFAAYRKFVDCTGQARKNQMTLIMSPSKNKISQNKDYRTFLLSKGIRFTDSDENYNHGELCPNSCPFDNQN